MSPIIPTTQDDDALSALFRSIEDVRKQAVSCPETVNDIVSRVSDIISDHNPHRRLLLECRGNQAQLIIDTLYRVRHCVLLTLNC